MKDGLIDSVDPRIDRLRDWVYGGEDFLRRVLSMAEGDDPVLHRRRVRSANPVSVASIFGTTASQYAVSADENLGFRSGTAGRDMAAYLCRRYTSATLRKLSYRFGLSHPAESRIPSLTQAKPSPQHDCFTPSPFHPSKK